MARFQEITSGVTKRYYSDDKWRVYNTVFDAYIHIRGLQFVTDTNLPFYLSYRTYNKGAGWLPYVSSKNANDYAGFTGTDTRYVQAVGIRVMDSVTGASLDKKYIVMYRAFINNKWLPWVSNATADTMRALADEVNLGGTLDTVSGNAGLAGSEHLMTCLQIYIFKDNEATGNTGSATGNSGNMETSYLVGNAWKTFTNYVDNTRIDGIKIQTSTSKNYYLLYKTQNEGRTSYYPAVTSIENDYAGYPNKPIQRINIQVCKSDGTAMTSGVIVMYRVRINGTWQDWVSNADSASMILIKLKYKLEGNLNSSRTYAGTSGQNIDGFEIYIYEENQNQSLMEYWNEFRRNRTRTIFNHLGIDLNDEIGFEVQMQVPGIAEIKYKVSRNTVIQPPSGVELVHYDIRDREFTVQVEDVVLDAYHNLSAEVTTGIQFTKPFFSFGFVQEIDEGEVNYGYQFTVDEVTFYYYISEVLFKDGNVEYTQTYEFEISFSKEDVNRWGSQIFEQIMEALEILAVVGVTVTAVYMVPIAISYLLSAGAAMTVASRVTMLALLISELASNSSDNQGTA